LHYSIASVTDEILGVQASSVIRLARHGTGGRRKRAQAGPNACAANGRLVRLLPKWKLPEVSIYAMHPSRQGLPLAVRMLLENLMANFDLWHRLHVVNTLQIADEKRRTSG